MNHFNCFSSQIHSNEGSRIVSDTDKLRIRSKYLLGSCAVQIVFLSGPDHGWTEAAKIILEKKIKAGVNLLKNYTFQSNPSQKLPELHFVFSQNTIESYCNANPTNCFNSGDLIQVNIKKFLFDQGYFNGNLNSISKDWVEPDVLQALYDYNNDQRDLANTDWAFLVFAIPNISPLPMTEVAWASEKLGLMVITDIKNDEDWVVSHETGHLFGSLDKSSGNCPNPLGGGGMYRIANSNCGSADALNCFMGERSRTTVCDVTLNQLSLQKNNLGLYIAENDFSVHRYELGDQYLQEENGFILNGDVIRKNRSVRIIVNGWTKMNGWFNAHGPEGDEKTIVGNDHLLPNFPFSCVIGKFISIDGRESTDWFYIGKGNKWFPSPYRGFLIFGLNDKRNNFRDNSGKLTIDLIIRIKDQLGSPWVWKISRENSLGQISPSALNIENDPDLAKRYNESLTEYR